jgi:hypothetical protein
MTRLHADDDAHDVGTPFPRRHAIDDAHDAVDRREFRLENERVGTVGAAHVLDVGRGRELPVTVTPFAEQRREARIGIESRDVHPLDRAVVGDERRRPRIADQRVVLDAQRHDGGYATAIPRWCHRAPR